MIVVDASALAAILFSEADARIYADRLEREAEIVIGAPTVLEARLAVLGRNGPEFLPDVERLIGSFGIRVLAFGEDHLAIATDAAVRYRGRPARLNFGDCMSYAVAKQLDAPLLFKGADFRHTDVRSAI